MHIIAIVALLHVAFGAERELSPEGAAQYGLSFLSVHDSLGFVMRVKEMKSDETTTTGQRVMRVSGMYSKCAIPRLEASTAYEKEKHIKAVEDKAESTMKYYSKCVIDEKSPLYECEVRYRDGKLSLVSCTSQKSGITMLVRSQRPSPEEDKAQFGISYLAIHRDIGFLMSLERLKSDETSTSGERVLKATAKYTLCKLGSPDKKLKHEKRRKEIEKMSKDTLEHYWECEEEKKSPLYHCEVRYRDDKLSFASCTNAKTGKITSVRVQAPTKEENEVQYALSYWSAMRVPGHMLQLDTLKRDEVTSSGDRVAVALTKYSMCEMKKVEQHHDRMKYRKVVEAEAKATTEYYWECEMDERSPIYECIIRWRASQLFSVSCENKKSGKIIDLRVQRPSEKEDKAQFALSYMSVQRDTGYLVQLQKMLSDETATNGERIIRGTAQYSLCKIPRLGDSVPYDEIRVETERIAKDTLDFYWECEIDEKSPMYECKIQMHDGELSSVVCTNRKTGKTITTRSTKSEDMVQYGLSYLSVHHGTESMLRMDKMTSDKMTESGQREMVVTARSTTCKLPILDMYATPEVREKATVKTATGTMGYYWKCPFDDESPVYECEVYWEGGKLSTVICKNTKTDTMMIV